MKVLLYFIRDFLIMRQDTFTFHIQFVPVIETSELCLSLFKGLLFITKQLQKQKENSFEDKRKWKTCQMCIQK